MATRPTPESYFESVPLENRWKLDKQIDFEHSDVQIHLGRIASSMDQWDRRVADELQLTRREIVAIKNDFSELEDQARAALNRWRDKFGLEATYRNLVIAFLNAEKATYAQTVCEQLQLAKLEVTGPAFQCPCTRCTLDSYIANGCPEVTPQGEGFPFLNTSELIEHARIDLEAKLLSDYEDIKKKFINLVGAIESSLDERLVDRDRLESSILKVSPGLKPELAVAVSVHKIFSILSEYHSFFNYQIIERIIKELGTKSDKLKLKQYTKDVNDFCKRSVFEVPPSLYGKSGTVRGCSTLAMKMSDRTYEAVVGKSPTLNDLVAAKTKIAQILGISTSSLYLCRVDEGCVEMLFLVPTSIFEAMLQKSFTKQAINELSSYGFTIVPQRTQRQGAQVPTLAHKTGHMTSSHVARVKSSVAKLPLQEEKMEPGEEGIVRFVLEGAKLNEKLGMGTYGKKYKVSYQGKCYVGKIFHVKSVSLKYYQACLLLSTLRHPSIEMFVGVCYDQAQSKLPILVTEKFDKSLQQYLVKKHRATALAKIGCLLNDVASGLDYLHCQEPPVVHGDLTASNIMMTPDNKAKITDLANNQILTLEPVEFTEQVRMYMPPEASATTARDVFSFGHLALFALLQGQKVDKLLPAECVDKPSGHHLQRTEVERRESHFQRVNIILPRGREHPLVSLMQDCLHNDPSQRPTAELVFRRVEKIQNQMTEWQEQLKRPMVLVVVGGSGAGKSTLVNNVLQLKGEDAAPTGKRPVTSEVKEYTNTFNEVMSVMVDTPAFESCVTDEQEEGVIKTLSKYSPDVLLYCIDLSQSFDYRRGRKIIEIVNRAFTNEQFNVWEHMVLVFTHSDVVESLSEAEIDRWILQYCSVFLDVLRDANVCTVQNRETADHTMKHFINGSIVVAVPVGRSPKKPSDWLRKFYKALLRKCHPDAIPALHAKYNVGVIAAVVGRSVGAGIVGGGVGAGVGSGVGAGIGAIVGATIGAAAGGAGAAPGAAIGAGTGAWIGAVVGSSVVGSSSFIGAAIYGGLKGADLYQEIAEINSIIAERYKPHDVTSSRC